MIKRCVSLLLILLLCIPITGFADIAVHYIDVGQADAALIICDGESMLIDGGNVADKDLIASYLDDQGILYLDYVIATHVHEDHIGGLVGALINYPVGAVMSPLYYLMIQRLSRLLSGIRMHRN